MYSFTLFNKDEKCYTESMGQNRHFTTAPPEKRSEPCWSDVEDDVLAGRSVDKAHMMIFGVLLSVRKDICGQFQGRTLIPQRVTLTPILLF